MAAAAAAYPQKGKELEAESKPLRIRITLTSLNAQALEKVCADFKKGAIDKLDAKNVKGPIRIPTKRLSLTVRKSPCGNGTNTVRLSPLKVSTIQLTPAHF